MDLETLYYVVTIRSGLSAFVRAQEWQAPAPPRPDFGVVELGARHIDSLLERQDRDTQPAETIAPPAEKRYPTPPILRARCAS